MGFNQSHFDWKARDRFNQSHFDWKVCTRFNQGHFDWKVCTRFNQGHFDWKARSAWNGEISMFGLPGRRDFSTPVDCADVQSK